MKIWYNRKILYIIILHFEVFIFCTSEALLLIMQQVGFIDYVMMRFFSLVYER